MARRKPMSVEALTVLGRERLSSNFFLRDFLFSEVAAFHGLSNIPDDPDLAIAAGRRLCEDLLEPLQAAFGRIVIRSSYRSCEVNGFANERQRDGKAGYTCASNEANYAGHIWDRRDAEGCMGATACIIVPSVWDRFGHEPQGWQRLAWWIHDHLPYASQEFFPRFWAFNLQWHEKPKRTISAYIPGSPRTLTKPGMDNHAGWHEEEWGLLLA